MDLRNGNWYYNYDIKSEIVTIPPINEGDEEKVETRYNYIQAKIAGIPNYNKCVKAIIRQYVDQDKEFDIINSYNSYQMDIDAQEIEYEEYLNIIKRVKREVGKDFGITSTPTTYSAPKQADITKLMIMTINSVDLTDSQALSVKSLYPDWSTFIGQTMKSGIKVQYNNKLFKVVQEHIAQEQYPPSIDTASIYTEIVEDHSGTIDDPIPYPADGNLVIYSGKYYIEDDILYLCIRDSGNPLYAKLSSLVGNYVEVVQ